MERRSPSALSTTALEPVDPLEELLASLHGLLGAERRLRGRDRNGALSNAHLRALAVLTREEEVTAGDLARAAELNPATVTAMIDHLERDGYVERRRYDGDRRVCLVVLTPKGREGMRRKAEGWRAVVGRALDGVEPEALSAAADVLGRLTVAFDGM